jgi:hypothetical protein
VADRDAEAEQAEQQQPHGARHWCRASLRVSQSNLVPAARTAFTVGASVCPGFGTAVE